MTSSTTAISGSFPITSFTNTGDFVGLSYLKEHGNIIITDTKSSDLYKVSDQQSLSSYTLKTDVIFSQPVVYDHEEEKFVGLVEHHGKKKICTWTSDHADYKDWKKKIMVSEVTDTISVEKSEPLIISSDDRAVWLSQYENSARSSISLIPKILKDKDIETSHIRAYKTGDNKTELVYRLMCDGSHCVYMIRFNGKRVRGQPVCLFSGGDITAVCRCPGPVNTTGYIATGSDGEIWRYTADSDKVEHIHTLPEDTHAVRGLHMLDVDQLLIASTDLSKRVGCLQILSLKFKTVRRLVSLSSDFCSGSSPLTVMKSHIITQTRDKLEAHSLKLCRLTLRDMLGGMSVKSAPSQDTQSKVKSCIRSLEKITSKVTAEKILSEFDNILLVEVLISYCKIRSSHKWSSKVITELLQYLVLPSHVLIDVCEAITRHDDINLIQYMVYKQGELPEQAIVILLNHVIKGLSSPTQTDDEDMDMDTVAADTVLDIPNNTASIINNLLSKDITDVFATEAMQKMEFAQVLVLLKYLCRVLCEEDVTSSLSAAVVVSDDDDDDVVRCSDVSLRLTEEQISRWCAVILDSHYTQIILSNEAELLVKLHDNIRQQVELQSSILKLGANLSAKPAQKKPSTGPYCIESVTFYY